MISFRYHIVSLVAVFFAMAIGVLVGTNVISDDLIDRLRAQRVNDRQELKAERDRIADLEAELEVWDRVGKETFDKTVQGKLDGRTIVVLAGSGTEDPITDRVVEGLERAGARVAARVAFTTRWNFTNEQDRAELATILSTNETTQDALTREAVAAIATRLRAPARKADDAFARMAETRFLRVDGLELADFPPRDAAFVYVQQPGPDPVPSAQDFAVPLIRGLASGARVAAAEPAEAHTSVTDLLTADDDLRARVATVDHADTAPGMYSLVIALADLLSGEAAAHYGTGPRTSNVIASP